MNGMKPSFVDLKRQYQLIRPQIQSRIDKVLEHGQYIMGPEVSELEDRLSAYTGSNHCITVASGTEALLISLMALDIGKGDEVITTAFSFIATAEVIVRLGAKPVFVDIDPQTCCIDSSRIEEHISERTKAIMPVSMFGRPSDIEEINALASRYGGIPVIEDAAQSFGASYGERKSCNLTTIGCTSFFPSKPLGCYGDGGAIFTNDGELAGKCREIRVHGQSQRYIHTSIGVGGRMDTLQCAIVLAKLDIFEEEISCRHEVAQRYYKMLSGRAEHLELLEWPGPDRTSVHAQFSILASNRERLIRRLGESEIPTAIHYPRPLHQQPAYSDYEPSHGTPACSKVCDRILSLPMHPYLDEQTQAFIAEVVVNC